jgi:hypothetical protein
MLNNPRHGNVSLGSKTDMALESQYPLYPRKRTLPSAIGMSALLPKQTSVDSRKRAEHSRTKVQFSELAAENRFVCLVPERRQFHDMPNAGFAGGLNGIVLQHHRVFANA